MSIIKKLITLEWFKTFFGSVIALFILISVSQLISGLLRTSVTSTEVLYDYVLSLPALFAKVLPLSCLFSTLFSLNKLKNKSEMIAIFAAGFSRKKFIITLLQCALAVSAVQFINLSYLEPLSKKYHRVFINEGYKKFRTAKKKGLLTTAIDGGKIWYRSKSYFMSFSYFDKYTGSLSNVNLFFFDEDHLSKQFIKASKAIYYGNNEWKLQDVFFISSLNNNHFPEFRKEKEYSIKLQEEAEDFLQIDQDISTLDPIGLYNFIKQIKKSGISVNEYEVLLYEKFTNTFMCIIFALFPISLIFSPNRRSSSFGKNIFTVIIFTVFYWFAYTSLVALGNSGKLPTFLALFALPMIFLAYFIFLFYKNRNLA